MCACCLVILTLGAFAVVAHQLFDNRAGEHFDSLHGSMFTLLLAFGGFQDAVYDPDRSPSDRSTRIVSCSALVLKIPFLLSRNVMLFILAVNAFTWSLVLPGACQDSRAPPRCACMSISALTSSHVELTHHGVCSGGDRHGQHFWVSTAM